MYSKRAGQLASGRRTGRRCELGTRKVSKQVKLASSWKLGLVNNRNAAVDRVQRVVIYQEDRTAYLVNSLILVLWTTVSRRG